MNLIILENSEFIADGIYHLKDRKKDHLIQILQAQVGDRFQAGILGFALGWIYIKSIEKDYISVEFEKIQETPLPYPQISLFSAFQRPQTTKKILQLSACLGFSRIHFFPFDKSMRSYQTSSLWKDRAWEAEFLLGLEQGKRIHPPKLHLNFEFREKLSFSFPKTTFLLDLEGKFLPEYEEQLNPEVGFILGPESGLTPKDREFFLDKGCLPLCLSRNVLRSEFALAFAYSQWEMVWETQKRKINGNPSEDK